MSAEGGNPQRLTTPDRSAGELGHWWPEALPGERFVVFTAFRTPVDRSRIGVLDLSTGQVRWVVDGGFFARYAPSGHLLYARGQRLFAIPFDLATATVRGPAVAVVDDLLVSQTNTYGTFAVSSSGMLAYVTESLGNPLRELVWLDRTGHPVPALGERRRFQSVNLSPDDRQAALTIQGESRDLWISSLERGALSRLTSGGGTEFDPMWSRDGRELFYIFDRPPFEMQRIGVGAPDSGRPIWNDRGTLDSEGIAVSPDGRSRSRSRSPRPRRAGISTHVSSTAARLSNRLPSLAARRETFRFRRTGAGSFTSRTRSAGQRFTLNPSRSGRACPGVVRRRDGPGLGEERRDLYLHDNEVRVVSTRGGRRVEFDAARTLFSYPIIPAAMHDTKTFDVTRDGSRIIAVTVPQENRPRQMEVVTDWTSNLERLAPRGGSR